MNTVDIYYAPPNTPLTIPRGQDTVNITYAVQEWPEEWTHIGKADGINVIYDRPLTDADMFSEYVREAHAVPWQDKGILRKLNVKWMHFEWNGNTYKPVWFEFEDGSNWNRGETY